MLKQPVKSFFKVPSFSNSLCKINHLACQVTALPMKPEPGCYIYIVLTSMHCHWELSVDSPSKDKKQWKYKLTASVSAEKCAATHFLVDH